MLVASAAFIQAGVLAGRTCRQIFHQRQSIVWLVVTDPVGLALFLLCGRLALRCEGVVLLALKLVLRENVKDLGLVRVLEVDYALLVLGLDLDNFAE